MLQTLYSMWRKPPGDMMTQTLKSTDWREFKPCRQTVEEWKKDPHCYHEKKEVMVEKQSGVNKYTSVCWKCESILGERYAEEEIDDATQDSSHNPNRFYNLRDMAEFDAYGTQKPSERKKFNLNGGK